MDIMYVCKTFPYLACVTELGDKVKKLYKMLVDLSIHHLEKKEIEGYVDHFETQENNL